MELTRNGGKALFHPAPIGRQQYPGADYVRPYFPSVYRLRRIDALYNGIRELLQPGLATRLERHLNGPVGRGHRCELCATKEHLTLRRDVT